MERGARTLTSLLAPAAVLTGLCVARAANAAPPEGEVERLDLGDGPPQAPAPAPSATNQQSLRSAPATVPRAASGADDDTFEARGWARSRTFAGFAAGPADSGELPPLAIPYDRVWSEAQLFGRLRYTRGRHFEVVASGLFTWNLYAREAISVAGTSLDARGSVEPSLRELYLGWLGGRADLRVGQQRIPWGKGDAFAPNAVLEPRELRDPLLTETEVNRYPVLAARGDVDLGALQAQLVWVPFFVPDRFDLYGTNWAFVQPGAPAAVRGLMGSAFGMVDPTLHPLLQPLVAQTQLPPADLSGSAVGVKLGTRAGPFDVEAYYHFGYTPLPYYQSSPELVALLATSPPPEAILGAAITAAQTGTPLFTATYLRRHHGGFAAETTAGPFVVRTDVAVTSRTTYLRVADFSSVVAPTAEAAAAVEWQPGEPGCVILVEGNYRRILDGDTDGLLGASRDTGGAALLARWLFFDHLELEARVLQSVGPTGTTARAHVAYKDGAFEARVGTVVATGEATSVGGYFQRNTGAFVALKYAY